MIMYRDLLIKAKCHLTHHEEHDYKNINDLFVNGGRWMQNRMNELNGNIKSADLTFEFKFYGYLKYGISIILTVLSALLFDHLSPFLIPLSVLVFYLAEVHFAFIFPLIIDDCKHPIASSFRVTYQTGFFTVLLNVVPIAAYMLSGIFSRKEPFQKWHIGCMAIIIWYQNEIRNRL